MLKENLGAVFNCMILPTANEIKTLLSEKQ